MPCPWQPPKCTYARYKHSSLGLQELERATAAGPSHAGSASDLRDRAARPATLLPQRDPADRFLAATAQVMDLTLVTVDDHLLRLGTIRTLKF